METSGYAVLAIIAFGMGVAFLFADLRSPTSRALSLFFCVLGALCFLDVRVYANPLWTTENSEIWGRVFGGLEALAFGSAYEWLLRIRRTELGREDVAGRGERLYRIAQALAALHGVFGLLAPTWRPLVWQWLEKGDVRALLDHPEVLAAVVPAYASLIPASLSTLELARSKPDSAEVVRLKAVGMSAPFLASGMFVPGNWMPITTGVGLAIFLVGAIRYHVRQGERLQFLSRFLSPQVASLVRERGLLSVLRKTQLEISVVCCDLRGFTAYTESAPSEAVVELLERYYAAVGSAAAEHGGTIKDHAGDGILVLVGAPLPVADGPERAVRMARGILEQASETLGRRWSDLGVGVGVATGTATVGAIAGASRLEYVAVGPAVNLAARLADRAERGQILVDGRTAALSRASGLHRLDDAQLKGFAAAVPVFADVHATEPTQRGPATA